MSDTVNIRVRLHFPGARVGDVIAVDKDQAERLVNAKYAEFTDDGPTKELVEAPKVIDSGPASEPLVHLPEDSALKAEWEAVASALGIPIEDADGKAYTKAVIMDEVKAALGSS